MVDWRKKEYKYELWCKLEYHVCNEEWRNFQEIKEKQRRIKICYFNIVYMRPLKNYHLNFRIL